MARTSPGLPVNYRDQGLTRPTLQRREHNDSQPVFALLPTEVILDILLALVAPPADIYDEDKDYQPAPCLSLSHTCRQFRQILLSSPSAWTLIPVNCHIDWTRECLRRSRPVPFSLVNERDSHWMDDPGKGEDAKMLALRELHRIRVLSLPGEDPAICHSLMRRAPELEFLSIGYFNTAATLPRDLLGAANIPLPKLRSVELECLSIHRDAHLLRATTLTNLTIVVCKLWDNTDAMISALSVLENLELLHVEHSIITKSFTHSQTNAPRCINLPRLRYLMLFNDFYQNLFLLHYLQLPQSLHALSLRNNEAPAAHALYDSTLQGFRALALPTLAPYMDDLVNANHGSLKLTLSVNSRYVDIAASWPISAEDSQLERFVEPDPDYRHPCLSVHVPHHGPGRVKFTPEGCQMLDALVQDRAFYASSRILSVDGAAEVLSDPRAWAAACNLPLVEILSLNRESAPGLVLALSTSCDRMPRFPKLRAVYFTGVIFDNTEPPNVDPEDSASLDSSAEEEYTGSDNPPPRPATLDSLFDRLMVAMEPWFKLDTFERVVIWRSTIADEMIDSLRARVGAGAVDWDGVRDGARLEEDEDDEEGNYIL